MFKENDSQGVCWPTQKWAVVLASPSPLQSLVAGFLQNWIWEAETCQSGSCAMAVWQLTSPTFCSLNWGTKILNCVWHTKEWFGREREKPERECIVSVVSLCSKNISLLFFSLTLSEPPCPAQVLLVLFGELMSLPELHRLSSIIANLVFMGNF